ncbi:hypothetical protein ABC974_24930 [Sphingomonas oligophenolica]|uniref:Uncharacterized protein n=1 Tax=Sphingomonas oligophenolica TaxID=301154 RepID=A0ABU9YAR5_9SPHN
MRKDIDHLPRTQQDELARVTQILMDEFSIAISRATQPRNEIKNMPIQRHLIAHGIQQSQTGKSHCSWQSLRPTVYDIVAMV